MFYVYILKSRNQNFHYIGHTKNLFQRLKAHNAGKVRSTQAYRPFTVINTEEYPTKSDAAKREYFLKSAAGNFWLRNHLNSRGLW